MSNESTPVPQGGDGSPAAPDLARAIEGLLNKHGDSNAALRVLLSENYELRDKLRDIKGKVPGDGAIVLAGDDVKRWHTYRELGEPSELRKGLGERDAYKAESEKFRRAETHREVATLQGYKPTVFAKLAEQDGLEFEIKEEKKEGQIVRTPYVKSEGGTTPLADYAESKWADFLPALKVSETVERPRPSGTPPTRTFNTPPPPPDKGGDAIYEETLRLNNYSRF